MGFDLDFGKEKHRLLASGACIATAALAGSAAAPTSPTGIIAGVLGGLASNVLASDIHARLARRLGRSRSVQHETALAQSLGKAVQSLIGQASEDPKLGDDRRAVKLLASKVPGLWETLSPLTITNQSLTPLSDSELVAFLTSGPLADRPVLEPAVWADVIGWMAESEGLSLRPSTLYGLAEKLHRGLVAAFYETLARDFATGGEAFATFEMLVWGELLGCLAEIGEVALDLRDEQKAALGQILDEVKTVTARLQDAFGAGDRAALTKLVAVASEMQADFHAGRGEILGRLDQLQSCLEEISDRVGIASSAGPGNREKLAGPGPAPSTALPPPKNIRYLARMDRDGDDVLVALHSKPKTVRRVVLHGMPAVGKTQCALAYVYQNSGGRGVYKEVYWTVAETEDQLLAGMQGMARRMGLPSDRPSGDIHAAIVNYLEQAEGWLWVFDNVVDIPMILKYLPSTKSGRVLITTTRPVAELHDLGAHTVELTHFHDPAEGARFLLNLAGLLRQDAPLSEADADDVDASEALSAEVGGLPLALDQAAAFIEVTASTPREYLRDYRSKGDQLRRLRSPLPNSRDHESVSVSFSIIFDRLILESPATADLLRLLAFYAPNGVPEEVLADGVDLLGDRLGAAVATDFAMTRLPALRNRIISRDNRARTISIHRLVQAVILDQMDTTERRQWAERAVRALDRAVPEVDTFDIALSDRVLPHLEVCAWEIQEFGLEFAEAGRLLDKAGCHLYYNGRYAESHLLIDRALEITQSSQGQDHPDTARSLNNKAILVQRLGSPSEADSLYRRAIEIRKDKLGPTHPVTAISLDNYGSHLCEIGRPKEGEPIARKALEIRRTNLGSDHPETAIGMCTLGGILRVLGQYDEAESLFREALAVRRAKLRPDHPWIAHNIGEIGSVLRLSGKREEAESLLRDAMASLEDNMGQTDVHLAGIMSDLAVLLQDRGETAEPESLLRRAVEIRREKLGDLHLNTGHSIGNLADFLGETRRWPEALPFARESLAIFERELGPSHGATINRRRFLAVASFHTGDLAEAESQFRRNWEASKELAGPESTAAKIAAFEYLATLRERGRNAEFKAVIGKLSTGQSRWVKSELKRRGFT